MGSNINVQLNFQAETAAAKSQIDALASSLKKIQSGSVSGKSIFDNVSVEKLQQATIAAGQLGAALNKSINPDSGHVNFNKLNGQLAKMGTDVKSLSTALINSGSVGQQAFMQLSNAIVTADNRASSFINKQGQLYRALTGALANQIVGKAMDATIGQFSRAYSFAQNLNSSLNNIRIVTGRTTEQMAEFAEQANKAAQALSTTTTKYTDAALIYFQQGLGKEDISEVTDRTDTTIKLANVTGQSAATVSEQLTAIWNNFHDYGDEFERYADIITALGATTASSSAEIAEGLGKFAAIADTVGLSYDYATSSLATLVAATRQSADTVGTSLKTIFSRLQGLTLGETLEDGVNLNKYSGALATVGVNAIDAAGNLRDMDDILEDLAEKWDILTDAQKMALAQTVAGVRQYTVLISLMDNWDSMKRNLNTAANAEGELNTQAEIFAESWEAAKKRVKASAEDIYSSLIDDKFFISLTNLEADLLSGFGKFIDKMGGMVGLLPVIGSLLTNVFGTKFSSLLDNAMSKLGLFNDLTQKKQAEALTGSYGTMLDTKFKNTIDTASLDKVKSIYGDLGQLQLKYNQNASQMGDIQRGIADSLLEQQKILAENATKYAQNLQEHTRNGDVQKNRFFGYLDTRKDYYNREATKPNASREEKTKNSKEANKYENVSNSLSNKFEGLFTEAKAIGEASEKMRILNRSISDLSPQNITEVKAEITGMVKQLGSAQDVSKRFGASAGKAFKDLQSALGQNDITKIQESFTKLYSIVGEGFGSSSPFEGLKQQILGIAKTANLDAEAMKRLEQALDSVQEEGRMAGVSAAQLDHSVSESGRSAQNAGSMFEQLAQKVKTVGTTITEVAGSLTGVITGLNSFKSAIQNFNNGDAFAGITGMIFGISSLAGVYTKLTATTAAQTLATKMHTIAIFKNVEAQNLQKLASAGLLAGLVAIVYVIQKIVQWYIAQQKAVADAAKANIEYANKVKETADGNRELVNSFDKAKQSYEDVQKAYEDGSATYEEVQEAQAQLEQASLAVCEAYGIEGGAVAALTGDYEKLAEAIRNAREEEMRGTADAAKRGVTGAEVLLRQSMLKGKGHTIEGGNYTASFNSGLSIADDTSILDYVKNANLSTISTNGGGDLDITTEDSGEGFKQAYEEAMQILEWAQANMSAKALGESEIYRGLLDWTQKSEEAYNGYIDAIGNQDVANIELYDLENNITDEISSVQDVIEKRQELISHLASTKGIDSNDTTSEAYQEIEGIVDNYLGTLESISKVNKSAQAVIDWQSQNQKWVQANNGEGQQDILAIGEQVFGDNWDASEEQLSILLQLDPTYDDEQLQHQLEIIQAKADNLPILINLQAAGEGKSLLAGEDKSGKNKTTNTDWENWWESNTGENGFVDWAINNGFVGETNSFFDWLVLSDDKKQEILNSFESLQEALSQQGTEAEIAAAKNYIESEAGNQSGYREELGKAEEEYQKLKLIQQIKAQEAKLDADSSTYDSDRIALQESIDKYNNLLPEGEASKSLTEILGLDVDEDRMQELVTIMDHYENLIQEYNQQQSIVNAPEEEDNGLKWATNFEDKVTKENFKYDEIKDYADYLKDIADETEGLADTLDDNSKAALQLSERFKRLNRGISTVQDSAKKFQDVLNAGSEKTAPEYIDALRGVQDSVGDLLDIDGTQLSQGFYESAENLALMEKAAEGDAESIDALRIAAANDIVQQCVVNINDDEILGRIGDLQTVINDFAANNDLEIGAELDDSAFLAACTEMINAAGMTASQASAYLASLGIDADVKEVPIQETVTRTVTVPKISYDSNGYPKLEGTQQESYTDTVSGLGGFALEVSNATWGGSSGGGISKSAAGGGKKGGGGGGSKKDKEKKPTDNKDRYHTVNEQLEDISNNLSKVSKESDRAFGVSRITSMTKELSLLNKQVDKYGNKLKEAQNYLAGDKASAEDFASKIGMQIEYGANGEILNWDALRQGYLDWYNSKVDSYNAGGMDEDTFDKEVEQVYDEALESFDQLEETNNLVQELKQNILESMQAYEDMALAIQKEKLEIKIQLDENGMKLLEYFFDKLDDDLYDGVEKMSIIEDKIANLIDQAGAYENNIAGILSTAGEWKVAGDGSRVFESYGLTMDDLPTLVQMSPEELAEKFGGEGSNIQEIINQLQEDYDNLLEINQKIAEERKNLIGQIGATFKAWNEEIDDNIDKIEEHSKLMEHYRNVIDIVGRKTLGITSAFIKDYNLKQVDNDIATLTSEYAQLNEMRASAAALEQDILSTADEESRKLMQKELDDMNHSIREQTEQTAQAWEDCMRGIQEAYEDTVAVALEDWQNKMAGIAGSADMLKLSFDMATDLDDNYLDDYDKIYELTKLTNDINKSIDETDDLENKEDLIELMEKVNDLNQSDADISQYTVDVLNARYDLLKAEAALKEAQNAKDTVRLTQDNEGNWGYLYTADQDKITQAEQEYADKLHALEEINQNYLDDLDKKLADLAADASDKITQIVQDNNLTLEEKKEKIQEVYEYTNEMERYLMGQTQIALNDAMEIYDQDARKYSELTGNKMLDDEKWVNSFGEMKISQITGIEELEDWDQLFADSWDDTITDIENTTDEFVEKNEEAMNVVGMTIEDASEQMSEDLNEIASATEKVKTSIVDMAGTATEEIGEVIDFAATWSEQWGNQIDAIISKNEALAISCDTIIKKLADAQAANDALEDLNQDDSGSQDGGSGGGGNNDDTGSGDSGGGGGITPDYTWPSGCNNCTGSCKDTCKNSCDITCHKSCAVSCDKGCTDDCNTDCTTSCSGTCSGRCVKTCSAQCYSQARSGNGYSTYLDTGGYTGLMQYADTGMYTGEWPNGSVRNNGRLAMLHQKELVLNAHDTENFLNAIDIVRNLNETLDLEALSMSKGIGNLSAIGLKDSAIQTIDQNVHITAEFPNVQNRSEIEEAFNNLVNKASQYANRKR